MAALMALDPITRAQSPVGAYRALGSGACAIPIEHLAAPPAGQPHEITFAPAAGEPAVGKGMSQLVRMESVAEPRLPAPLSDDLSDTAVGQPSFAPDPQPGQVGVNRALAHPHVPIEGADRLRSDGNDAFAPPLAEHPQDALVEVDIVGGIVGWDEAKSRDLGPSGTGIDEDPDDGGIASILE